MNNRDPIIQLPPPMITAYTISVIGNDLLDTNLFGGIRLRPQTTKFPYAETSESTVSLSQL